MDFLALSALYTDMYTNGTPEQRSFISDRYTALYNYLKDNNLTEIGPDISLPDRLSLHDSPMEWYPRH